MTCRITNASARSPNPARPPREPGRNALVSTPGGISSMRSAEVPYSAIRRSRSCELSATIRSRGSRELRLDARAVGWEPVERLSATGPVKAVEGRRERQAAALLEAQRGDPREHGARVRDVVARAVAHAPAHDTPGEVVHVREERLGRDEVRRSGGNADDAHVGAIATTGSAHRSLRRVDTSTRCPAAPSSRARCAT